MRGTQCSRAAQRKAILLFTTSIAISIDDSDHCLRFFTFFVLLRRARAKCDHGRPRLFLLELQPIISNRSQVQRLKWTQRLLITLDIYSNYVQQNFGQAVDRETKLNKCTLLDPASATRRENTCVVYLPYTNCRYLAHPVLIIAIIGGLLYTFNTGNYT